MRKQEGGESVDAFIMDLYALAEHCGYNTLHDEMIRDRLVVGLRDAALLEKLQLDAELTLDKAVTTVRQAEAVKKQQSVLRGEGAVKPDIPVGAIQSQRREIHRLDPDKRGESQPINSHPQAQSVPDAASHLLMTASAAQRGMPLIINVGSGDITRGCVGLPKLVWFRRMRPIRMTLMMLSLEQWAMKVRNPGQ